MKNLISKGWAFAAAAAAIVSCTKNVEEEKPSINEGPKFPEKQQIEIPAGEQKVLTFTAEADWKLVIDKTTWCAFIDNGVETAQISGKAGEVNATVAVKDNGLDFTSDVAKIDLTLDTKTETIYEITRPGKAREIKLYVASGYDAEFSESEGIEFVYKEDGWGGATLQLLKFAVVANYDWTVAAPEGFTFSSKDYTEIPGLSGKAGVGIDGEGFTFAYVDVKEEISAYEKESKIVVTDSEGNNPVEFKLYYPGLYETAVSLEPANVTNPFGLNFTTDGFKINKTWDSADVTEEKSVDVTVKVKNMKYTMYLISVEDGKAMELGAESWLKVTDDGEGALNISVAENTSGERIGYVLVLPEALSKDFKLESFVDEYGNVNYDYDRKYIKVTQKGVTVTKNFTAVFGRSYKTVPTVDFFEYPDFADMTPSDLHPSCCADNIYVIEISDSDVLTTTYDGKTDSAGALQVAPLGFPDGYYPVGATADDNLFTFIPQSGDWNEKYIGDAPMYTSQGLIHGIQIDPEQFINVETLTSKNFQGMAIVQFYKNVEGKAAYKSSATLVIVKK